MNRFLILAVFIFTSTTAQFTYCEAEAVIGDATATNECPRGYTYTSIGWCCALNSIKYMECKDKVNNQGVNECPGLKGFCNHSMFKPVMINDCAKTCGFCS